MIRPHCAHLLRQGLPAPGYGTSGSKPLLFNSLTACASGTPLHVVAQRLGHRDPMVTATTYAHVTADQAENASVVFAKAIS
ncbi:MAG: hypothetical protein ACKOAJ_04370 [Actinomycetota bacterium]